jgi:hypothetical protein
MKEIFDFLLAVKWPLFAVVVIWKVLGTYQNIVKMRWEKEGETNEAPPAPPKFRSSEIGTRLGGVSAMHRREERAIREKLSVREGDE